MAIAHAFRQVCHAWHQKLILIFQYMKPSTTAWLESCIQLQILWHCRLLRMKFPQAPPQKYISSPCIARNSQSARTVIFRSFQGICVFICNTILALIKCAFIRRRRGIVRPCGRFRTGPVGQRWLTAFTACCNQLELHSQAAWKRLWLFSACTSPGSPLML